MTDSPPSARRAGILVVGLAALALAAAACTGGTDGGPPDAATAPAAIEAAATASPTPTAEPMTAAAPEAPVGPSPEAVDAAVRALMGMMRGGGEDPFTGPPESLPPEVRALLDALGVDLLLGVVFGEAGATLAVEAVFPGSPAERAGLAAAGDVVTAIDGEPTADPAVLRAAVEAVGLGESYALTVARGGAERTIEVERPSEADTAWRSEMLRTLALGLMLADRPGASDVPPSLLGEMLEETPDGLRVFAVFPGSPADRAGLRAGDLVLAIDGRPLASLDDLRALMTAFNPAGGEVEVAIRRDGEDVTLRVDVRGGLLGGAPTR